MLKKGGVLLFRDYAEGDMAQVRFESEGVSKIADNFHVRGDGTRAYYFSTGITLPEPHSTPLMACVHKNLLHSCGTR